MNSQSANIVFYPRPHNWKVLNRDAAAEAFFIFHDLGYADEQRFGHQSIGVNEYEHVTVRLRRTGVSDTGDDVFGFVYDPCPAAIAISGVLSMLFVIDNDYLGIQPATESAAEIEASVRARQDASLNAGTMTDIFIRALE
jgi:hypothetical protein